jgi:hypothetical protein
MGKKQLQKLGPPACNVTPKVVFEAKDRPLPKWQKKAAARPPVIVKPTIYGQGVTGSDLSKPYFDGTSMEASDFLIDLDTDSMETAPDVRSYFFQVAQLTQDPENPPVDIKARRIYDDKMVKKGREFLKAARDRGPR